MNLAGYSALGMEKEKKRKEEEMRDRGDTGITEKVLMITFL